MVWGRNSLFGEARETTLLANGHLNKFNIATHCLLKVGRPCISNAIIGNVKDSTSGLFSMIHVYTAVRQSFQSTMQWRQVNINHSFSANRKLDWRWQSVGGIGSLQLTVFWQKPAHQSDGWFSSVYCLLFSWRTCIPRQTWLDFVLH